MRPSSNPALRGAVYPPLDLVAMFALSWIRFSARHYRNDSFTYCATERIFTTHPRSLGLSISAPLRRIQSWLFINLELEGTCIRTLGNP